MNEHDFLKQLAAEQLDKEKIRRRVLDQKNEIKRRWLIPVVACVAGVVVICTAVPPVHAALVKWFAQTFQGVEDYMSRPQKNREQVGELDAMIEQAKPSQKQQAQENSVLLTMSDPAWQDWADELAPKIGDVYFDGEKLVVAFDMGGGAPEFLGARYMSLENGIVPFPDSVGFMSGYVTINGETYSLSPDLTEAPIEFERYMQYETEYATQGEIPREEWGEFISEEGKQALRDAKSVLFTATVDLDMPSTDYTKDKEMMSTEDYASWQETIKEWRKNDPEYDPEHHKVWNPSTRMEGVQNIELSIPLMYTDYSVPGVVEHQDQDGASISYQGGLIGMLRIKCSVDPAAGYENIKTYEIQKTMNFSGQGRFATYDSISEPGYAICNNITKDLAGVQLHIKRMIVSPSGTKLYVGVTCPADWTDIEKGGFLSSLLFMAYDGDHPIPSKGEGGLVPEENEDMSFYMMIDALPSELEKLDTISLRPTLSRYAGHDDVPYEEGKPTKIKEDEILGWQENSDELEACQFDFTLDMQ